MESLELSRGGLTVLVETVKDVASISFFKNECLTENRFLSADQALELGRFLIEQYDVKPDSVEQRRAAIFAADPMKGGTDAI